MSNTFELTTREAVVNAFVEGGRLYFEECRARVPGFARHHFTYPGCWQTNKAGIGWDMVRTPLNLFWAPVYALVCIVLLVAEAMHLKSLARTLRKVPAGFTTNVQKQLGELIERELLLRPKTNSTQSSRISECVTEALAAELNMNNHQSNSASEALKSMDSLVEETLKHYGVTRTASSDITNVAASLILGAVAFKKFTPGGLGLGMLLAAFVAKASAANQFVFGQTLGRLFYSIFTPAPSLTLSVVSTCAILCLLAFFSSISGLISDPIQYLLKIHKRRLYKMIDALERDYMAKAQSRFRPKDHYLARLFDLFDALRTNLF